MSQCPAGMHGPAWDDAFVSSYYYRGNKCQKFTVFSSIHLAETSIGFLISELNVCYQSRISTRLLPAQHPVAHAARLRGSSSNNIGYCQPSITSLLSAILSHYYDDVIVIT